MNIQDILKQYQEQAELKQFCEELKAGEGGAFNIRGMAGSQPVFVLAALFRNTHRNTLVILNDREDALYFQNDLHSLMPKKEVLFFPSSAKRPYQVEEVENANVLQRAEVLNQINHTQSGRQLIVTYGEALAEKVINRRSLVRNTLEVRKGEAPGMDFVVEVLEEYGFEQEDFVYEPGQFAMRGGILDVYSFGNELPYRIEFFGSEIESIRAFDPVTQLSLKESTHVSLIPNIQKNLLDEERIDFLDYIPENTQVFIVSPDLVRADLERHFTRAVEHFESSHSKTGGASLISSPEKLYTSPEGFDEKIRKFRIVEIGNRQSFAPYQSAIEWPGSPQPAFHKEFNLLGKHLHENKDQHIRNYIFSENEKQFTRLHEIFNQIEHDAEFEGVKADIHSGFLDRKLNIACYTDHQIFERYHRYQSKAQVSRSQALTLKELKELQPGDFVTHVHHGIGRFAGLHRILSGANEMEAVKIIFRDGDEILVNVNSLHKISKYSGKEGAIPKLSKLGSGEWQKTKAKTKRRVKELAFDLINLYAERKAKKGFAFTPDNYMQQELEANFMFEDTPDQIKCTEEVKRDMESDMPMDRLVCGDVGFGKTEIAVRAAFKAVCDGKQVAVLVPTTILALQHFHTFSERLKEFPVTVEYINRFRSAKDQKEILEKTANGKIDILIGTHKLVGKDMNFKDLGLLVIDEEQKFGVGVKEKLKLIRATVDTLTLTATPIPRTLQFSLAGLRDLSVIATPPPNRQPVETRVHTLDARMIRDAISYELKRGGQVFFVHNKIEELVEIGNMVRKLVPDARIAIAHGQMEGKKVEEVMENFVEGNSDVLLCTTIIESGLDIPNANTIIINQAQNFGLSDLHQMRGRVGRSNRKAFCYLFSPDPTVLTRDAQKRLRAIEEFSDLGAGFNISLRDLDIRGAGDLLGPEQSGFINEIGYDMYHRLLDEALLELKEEHFADLFKEEIKKKRAALVEDTQVETDQSALIPEQYIPSISERLNFYNRISAAEKEDELRNISIEMIDRFGPVPEQVFNLFDTIRIRWMAQELAIEKVVIISGSMRLYFISDKESKFYASETFGEVLSFVKSNPSLVQFKQSPKFLYLIIKDVHSLKEGWGMVKELHSFVLNANNKETVNNG